MKRLDIFSRRCKALLLKQDTAGANTQEDTGGLDFDLLRRDEIWFVNKKKSGESDIYSLEEYNARFDQKIDNAYLEGRYGVFWFSILYFLSERYRNERKKNIYRADEGICVR